MKKIIALVLALAMILMVASVFADGEGGSTPVNDNRVDTTFKGSPDGTISVGGLDENDKVKFYKVLEFSQDASIKVADLTDESDMSKGAGGWKFTSGFSSLKGSDLKAILSRGITDELAGKIAKLATGTAKYELTVGEGANSVQTSAEDGLYVAIITAGKAGVVYNPIFVGSDYYVTGDKSVSSNWTVTELLSYSNSAMAKKTTIKVDKTAVDTTGTNDSNTAETAAVGDVMKFTVKSTIPEFADNYTKAVYNVTDVLSEGLTLDTESIHVYSATVDENDNYTKGAEITSGFTIPNETLTAHGYKIVFTTNYLLGLSAAQPIWIEYEAEVTSAAVTNVNPEDNTVTINYSNNPTDETGNGYIKDETKNYSFSIDANLLGTETTQKPWKTVEVVKVGLDKDGKEILVETVTWHEGEPVTREIGPLAGAEFTLLDAQKNVYTNKYIAQGTKIVSDSTGRLTISGTTDGIKGLDAGVYYLRETKAPDGYIKAQEDVKIEIKTVIEEVTKTDDNGVSWKYKELKSYSIEIDGKPTASYTMVNDHEATQNTEIPGTDGLIGAEGEHPHAADGKIKNTQGVELPSTGGIGTTIFYILGGVLVIGAAVILVARRKAHD